RFVEQLGKGFEKLAPAIDPLSKAFTKLMDAIGPALPGIFQGIADALIEIANVIAENPDLFAGFITGLLKLIPWTLKLIEVLAKIFAKVSDVMGTTYALVTVLGLLFTPLIIAIALWRRFKEILEQAKPTLESLWQKVQTVFEQIWQKINTVVTLIWGIISTGFNFIKTIVTTALDIIKAVIFGDFEEVKATVRDAVTRIKLA